MTAKCSLAFLLAGCIALLSLPAVALADGMGPEKPAAAPAPKAAPAAPKSAYEKIADNFVIMLDLSGSMAKPYQDGMSRLAAAKGALAKVVRTIPDELNYTAAMYAFAPHWQVLQAKGPFTGWAYDRTVVALPEAPASSVDPTPLGEGMKQLAKEMKGFKGKTIVYLLSDGHNTDDVNPVAGAKGVAKAGGCFYVISLAGEDRDGADVLKKIASVNSCSSLIDFDQFLTHPEMCVGQICRLK